MSSSSSLNSDEYNCYTFGGGCAYTCIGGLIAYYTYDDCIYYANCVCEADCGGKPDGNYYSAGCLYTG